MATLLIIDDEEKLRGLLSRILGLEGFVIKQAANGKDGLHTLRTESIDVVLCDVKLPDINGVDLVKKIKEISEGTEIILLTAYGTIADGVQAMKNGAFDYITKGDDNEKILPLVNKAIEKRALYSRVEALEKKVDDKFSFDRITGNSSALLTAKNLARKVAPMATNVLLLGETGTGKEVFAQAIHQASPRKQKSFVAINCGAIPKDLLESEMFGYKAGAFSGAGHDKKGLFEEADGGTLFLDEMGEMDIHLQAKILRVIETGTFIKIGDTKNTSVNVRIISATNKDLSEEIKKGVFRIDLFYRLSVFQIMLPSLRERPEDIPDLAQFFLVKSCVAMNKKRVRLSVAFVRRLQNHSWKGNIRELKNVIERAVILNEKEEMDEEVLPSEFFQIAPGPLHADNQDSSELDQMEKRHIRKVLDLTRGNKVEAAKILKIGLTTLYRKMDTYDLH